MGSVADSPPKLVLALGLDRGTSLLLAVSDAFRFPQRSAVAHVLALMYTDIWAFDGDPQSRPLSLHSFPLSLLETMCVIN